MVNANNDAKHLPVFKLDGQRNKMLFIHSFPGIVDHFGVRRIIYENMARPVGGDDLAKRQVAWDNLNTVSLEKLWYYVMRRVDDMVTQGEEVTVRVYYQRLCIERLFLRTGAESVVSLREGKLLANICRRGGDL